MTPLLVALLGVLLIPLFIATWRTILLGLGCQGLLLAAIAYHIDPTPRSAHEWLMLLDFAVVRGLGIPFALYGVLRARKAPARSDLIPPHLLSWTVALVLVLASFSFAQLLVKEAGEQRTLVAIAVAGVLLGFLVLATQFGPFSQMMGALRIENAVALLELGGERHESAALGVQLGLIAVFIATLLYFRGYLTSFGSSEPSEAEALDAPLTEGPTL